MFDSHEVPPSGFSPSLFVIQLVLAPLVGLLFGFVTYLLLEEAFRVRNSMLLGYLAFSVQGFLLGYKMQTAFPRAIQSGGRWLWIAAVFVLGLWILNELGRGPRAQVEGFFVFPKGPGLGGLEMVVITWPVVATCFYTIGVIAAARHPRSPWGKRLRRLIVRENSSNGDKAEPSTAAN
jgi:hypothetical protein